MSIKWVKVCDSHGKIHTFDDDLEGCDLSVVHLTGGGLIVNHHLENRHDIIKQSTRFNQLSWHQVMTDL